MALDSPAQALEAALRGARVVKHPDPGARSLDHPARGQRHAHCRLVDVAVDRRDLAERFQLAQHPDLDEIAGVQDEVRRREALAARVGNPASPMREVRVGDDGDDHARYPAAAASCARRRSSATAATRSRFSRATASTTRPWS